MNATDRIHWLGSHGSEGIQIREGLNWTLDPAPRGHPLPEHTPRISPGRPGRATSKVLDAGCRGHVFIRHEQSRVFKDRAQAVFRLVVVGELRASVSGD